MVCGVCVCVYVYMCVCVCSLYFSYVLSYLRCFSYSCETTDAFSQSSGFVNENKNVLRAKNLITITKKTIIFGQLFTVNIIS